MDILAHTAQPTQQDNPPTKIETCALGQPLGDCPARRAGCGSHLTMLKFMYPPLIVTSYIRATMNNADALAWLARLDAVLPGARGDRARWWR